MPTENEMKELRKRVYSSYHQDGILDVLAGMVILLVSLSWYMGIVWLSGIIVIAIVPLFLAFKNWLSVPRVGYVKFKESSMRKQYVVLLVAGLSVLFLFLFVLPDIDAEVYRQFLIDYGTLIFGAALAAFFAMAAYGYGVGRFYAYAALTFVTFAVAEMIGGEIWPYLFFLGAALLGAGMVVMLYFVRANPKTRLDEG